MEPSALGMLSSPASPDRTFALEGLALGRLELLERVRAGAAGTVFLAVDGNAGRARPVEVLVSEPVASAARRRALVDDARAAAALAHPNIAPLLDAGEVGGRVYVVMEPLEGRSLGDLLGRGSLARDEALRIAETLACGLAAAHQRGIAHLHLGPERVTVAPDGRAVLSGFGLAAWGAEAVPAASESRRAAPDSARWAAPEQLRGEAGSPRADVYGFGVLVRELLGGAGDGALGSLVARCLDEDPAARFEDARAVLEAWMLLATGDRGGAGAKREASSTRLAPPRDADDDGTPRGHAPHAQAPRPRTGRLSVRLAREHGAAVDDDFELVALAGSGGMGEVYRARHAPSGQAMALKLLVGGDGRRFAREAAVLASFRHPGVVRYEGHGVTEDGTPVLAMEWLEGEDLDGVLRRGPLSIADTVVLARRAAEALAAAHLRGIVHRDVKPANLFLVGGRVDAPKLVDFGLARPVEDDGLTAPGTVLGTLAYMAPEQIRGEAVDARADVYGLGAVMYRCIAGHPPFAGAHRIAVLAKVLVEDPQPLAHLVPAVPRGLDALVRRMLAKDPDARPADGAAVLEAIGALDAFEETPRSLAGITAREQRVACVVLARAKEAEEVTLPSDDASSEPDVRAAVEERGGVLAVLARGTWLVTVRGAASPAEQAARALRCALVLASPRPGMPVVVATGRVVASGDAQVGEVIDRAAAALLEAREGGAPGVRIDEATASLLDDRFEIDGTGPWRRVLGERSTIAPVRTLLGKPAACVGRTQELAALDAALEECAGEPRARAVLVTAAPGLGKSRLVHEFLSTTVAARGEVDVLFARGDAVRSGSPFGILSQMIRGAASILDSDAAPARRDKLAALLAPSFDEADRRRLEDFLGEICGAPVPHDAASPALRAARADAAAMGDGMREAWVDWIDARADDAPTLLVIEDLHWADLPSVRLLDAALDALPDRPLLVLATARPEVHFRFPDLWQKRGLQQLALAPLSKRAAQRLVREALGDRGEAVEEAIVARAAGHPFHLEELVRAVASGLGAGALPDSVLGMIQARLDVLGPLARRALRAASVFGETFWSGGVRAVVGDEVPADEVAALLGRLAAEEVVTRRSASRLLGETEFTFRHALVRDAAYATLTDHDRALAHLLAAAWLERTGEGDPATLADHYHRGGAPGKALGYYRRAAEQALEGNDLERAAAFADRALACGPDRATEGALGAMLAEVAYWRGSLDEAEARAGEAVDRLAEGSAEWFGAVSVAIGALGQRGRNDGAAGWLDRAARAASAEDARGAQAVTLCRGMTQLFWAHHRGELGEARARLDELTRRPELLDPHEAGWVHRVRAESAWLHHEDLDRCRAEFAASCDAFRLARAQRNLSLTEMNWASLAGWSGDTERGLELVDRARREASRIGAGFLVLYSTPVRGLVEAYAGLPSAAETMRAALPKLAPSPRLAFIARIVLGCLALEGGDLADASEHADAAMRLPVVPELRPAALALRARVRLAEGRLEDALEDALVGTRLASEREDLELTAGMSDLALVEAYEAKGDRESARDALAAVHARLAAIARTLAASDDRRRFWARRLPNDRIAALATAWGIAHEDDR